MDIKQVLVKKIKNYKLNSKIHTDEQIKEIAKSIQEFGFTQPIVVDKDNTIIIGHGRLFAAKRLGFKKVPCVVKDNLTEDQINALRIIDNKLNTKTGYDEDLLKKDLEENGFNFSDFNIGLDEFIKESEDEFSKIYETESAEVDSENIKELIKEEEAEKEKKEADEKLEFQDKFEDVEEAKEIKNIEEKKKFKIEVFCDSFEQQLEVLNYLRSENIEAAIK